MSVRRVRVERDVGNYAELGKRFFTAATVRGTSPFGFVASRPSAVFRSRFDHRKNRERRNAELHALLGVRQQRVDRIAVDPGHRGDRFGAALAVDHEHGIDQIIGGQTVFPHQTARKIVAAVPAHPALREITQDFHTTSPSN